jgi:mono/diheme cytochrome c family protein
MITTGAPEAATPTSPTTARRRELSAQCNSAVSAAARIVTVGLAAIWALAAYALEPQVNFQLQCMGCHHADGAGEKGRVPSIRRTLVLFSALPEGREYLLRVPGVAQATLSDQDLAALMNWMVRNLSDVPLPQNFAEFTAAEVGTARRQPLAAVIAQRARLLDLINLH